MRIANGDVVDRIETGRDERAPSFFFRVVYRNTAANSPSEVGQHMVELAGDRAFARAEIGVAGRHGETVGLAHAWRAYDFDPQCEFAHNATNYKSLLVAPFAE